MLLLIAGQSQSSEMNWWTNSREQNVIQSLMTEAIGFYGINVAYLPVTLRREDTLYNEDILRKFTNTYSLTVYINDTMGWRGQGDFLSKFGVKIQDKVSVMISRETFANVFANSNPLIERPMEGDLVYFPRPIEALFEIKLTTHERGGKGGQFYPIGKLTYYEVDMELHTYNQENINTGNTIIDIIGSDEAYAQILTLTTGDGNYSIGETVYQGETLESATATGIVGEWNTPDLKLSSVSGTFSNGVNVIGATSLATYLLGTANTVVLPTTSDNLYLTSESANILDTSEQFTNR